MAIDDIIDTPIALNDMPDYVIYDLDYSPMINMCNDIISGKYINDKYHFTDAHKYVLQKWISRPLDFHAQFDNHDDFNWIGGGTFWYECVMSVFEDDNEDNPEELAIKSNDDLAKMFFDNCVCELNYDKSNHMGWDFASRTFIMNKALTA